ncbi:hypothetical protein P154DRAFT_518035 [Amniculicola lignicola CBS 123094]|uniref:Uncharacterized protein n=1 Tax=Amniculicola lignicola CBS 123094 TaxID=1392246 RepID=A0A6A5WXJ2_9PLEO|nr:hypothetical protein P154DRAFT_518035 [Amniculicola lignicola CBS 123094]
MAPGYLKPTKSSLARKAGGFPHSTTRAAPATVAKMAACRDAHGIDGDYKPPRSRLAAKPTLDSKYSAIPARLPKPTGFAGILRSNPHKQTLLANRPQNIPPPRPRKTKPKAVKKSQVLVVGVFDHLHPMEYTPSEQPTDLELFPLFDEKNDPYKNKHEQNLCVCMVHCQRQRCPRKYCTPYRLWKVCTCPPRSAKRKMDRSEPDEGSEQSKRGKYINEYNLPHSEARRKAKNVVKRQG